MLCGLALGWRRGTGGGAVRGTYGADIEGGPALPSCTFITCCAAACTAAGAPERWDSESGCASGVSTWPAWLPGVLDVGALGSQLGLDGDASLGSGTWATGMVGVRPLAGRGLLPVGGAPPDPWPSLDIVLFLVTLSVTRPSAKGLARFGGGGGGGCRCDTRDTPNRREQLRPRTDAPPTTSRRQRSATKTRTKPTKRQGAEHSLFGGGVSCGLDADPARR